MSASPFRDRVLTGRTRQQVVTGSDFILTAPDHVPAIFGREREVIWAEGESLLIVGPQGTGKTSLMQQLALRRAGALLDELIGYPVTATEQITLYCALDRPAQIARSFKRMVNETHELARLIVWRGPLPFNIVKQPELLLQFLEEIGEAAGGTVDSTFIDSLKDVASPLSSDEVGAAVNRAIGGCIAAGIQVCASHHGRKATTENRKPNSLADVYGSTWITAGAGSVISLWGEAGDPIVEMTHLKQPAEEVGPLELAHDHQAGITTRREHLDAWTALQSATAGGVTAGDAALAIYGVKATKAQIEKARRKLERYVEQGHATKVPGRQITDPTLYRPVSVRERSREQFTPSSHPSTNGSTEPHAPLTPPHAHIPPIGNGGNVSRTDDELQALIDSEKTR